MTTPKTDTYSMVAVLFRHPRKCYLGEAMFLKARQLELKCAKAWHGEDKKVINVELVQTNNQRHHFKLEMNRPIGNAHLFAIRQAIDEQTRLMMEYYEELVQRCE